MHTHDRVMQHACVLASLLPSFLSFLKLTAMNSISPMHSAHHALNPNRELCCPTDDVTNAGLNPPRFESDVVIYNQAAAKVVVRCSALGR